MKTLKKVSSNVDSLHTDYCAIDREDQDMTEIELEECIEELQVSLNQLLHSNEKEAKSSQLQLNSFRIKLAEIPLLQFSGKHEDWELKIELNKIVTNNEKLSEVQKLHFLHSTLKI